MFFHGEAGISDFRVLILAEIRHIESLLQHLGNYHRLSQEALAAIATCIVEHIYEKNTLLITEGKVCRHIYFLQKGALRGFYNQDGKEITHWFGFENDFLTSFHSFITQQPSVENLQFVEPSVICAISKEKLNNLMKQFHEIETLVRIAYEKYYIRLEERFINAHFKTAKERYHDLLQQSPHLLNRIPLGYIASYLGISQETLSRIRSKV